jgi:acetyl-CoA carboxylase biotin carboxyl carrier protein
MASEVLAPMTGKILKILVNVGDAVSADDEIIILEAMKMEHPILVDEDGTVKEIKVKEGDSVEADAVLAVIG